MASQSAGLERNAIGLTAVTFQSITHMAPAVATALSIGAATIFAGGATPLAVVLALIAALFTAYGIGQLAKHLPSAGGMYTYVARGLGGFLGWLMAWAFALAEPIIAPALYASFGLFGALLITQLTGFSSPYLWLVLAILCGLLVWWLLYRGISFSTGVGIALGTIEIVIFLGISALLIINAGSKNTLSVFLPGADGLRPAFQGMVFTLLAFVGFEAAAPLGEEARDPKKTIPRAVMLSCILIGVFYAFNYYAATVFFGPDRMASEFYTFNNGDPWGYMADQVLPGIGSLLIAFAIINSSLANANSGATAATRSLFNMGRTGLITKWFGAIHATHRTPVNSIHFQAILALVLVVALGFYLGNDPLKVYVFIGYGLGLLFAGMYIAVNIAVIGFYLRERRAEFNWFKHLVVPILGIVFVIPAFATVLGIANVSIPILDIPLSAIPAPYDIVPALVAIWMVLGIVLYFVLRSRRPDAFARVGEVYGESPVGGAADASATDAIAADAGPAAGAGPADAA